MAIEEIVKMKQLGDVEMQYVYKLTQVEYNEKEAYGIAVERKDIINGKVVNVVSEEIRIISNIKNKVRSMLEKLSRNEVSVLHLIDIIGEEVDNCVFDF